jgi:hypothetical protein
MDHRQARMAAIMLVSLASGSYGGVVFREMGNPNFKYSGDVRSPSPARDVLLVTGLDFLVFVQGLGLY